MGDNLEVLEKKVSDKSRIDGEQILEELNRVYRLVSNTTKRIEKQLQYIEDKQNKLLEITKYKPVDTLEVKRLQEIQELENRLKELRGV